MVINSEENIKADVEAIGRIPIVPKLLEVICRTTGMGFAAIARVSEDKWVACSVRDEISFGLNPGDELKAKTTICHEIRQSGEPVIIDDVKNDIAFINHHTPALYGFQSYISVPIIRKDGSFFGTLCAIDLKPALLNSPETIGMFNLFTDLISFHLDAIEQTAFAEAKLLEEREMAKLQEQCIAILGHDLRNPVGAIGIAAQLMLRMPLNERMTRLANIIQDSTFRMKGLIENILDFVRLRLGEAISLNYITNEPLEKVLRPVITELQLIWPDRVIETQFSLMEPVNCDGKRIAQLLSNILSNALTHGNNEGPVRIKILSGEGEFILSVANSGKMIPADMIAILFNPFASGEKSEKQGLGLGLYISSEIARAHHGSLNVTSTPDETIFTLQMPTQYTKKL